MELDYKWARVKFLNWSVKMSSNTGNIFVQLVAQHCQHCKLKSVVAFISTFAPNLSHNKFQCCKLRQHIVAQSRPQFYFLQQTFNFVFCVTTCYASQHLWLVNFQAPKAREIKDRADKGWAVKLARPSKRSYAVDWDSAYTVIFREL